MNSHIPKGASFGVKLENAPPGVTNEHIPLIVELCVQIVETRGLDTVGIYRVPGNNASVSVLTDLVNQGIDDDLIKDARWNDVNIVSSLLKAFFRKLPEPLLTSYLYPKFIQASETEDPVKRLKAIKHVLYHLPVHYFATLRYLMYHLKKVVEHSATNKMEARNLAIVFGPTLVRTIDNNMIAMVTDMPQQCYLIETMITYAEWLFEDCGDILPLEINVQDKRKTHPPSTIQSNALLSNINKLDESLPHEMFTSFCNAASRHLRHRQKKKDPASYSKKRSGIIADDTDILANPNDDSIPSNFSVPEITNSKVVDTENLSDLSFGSCSSLISGSSKSKQRSVSKELEPQNDSLAAERQSSESSQETSSAALQPEEELVGQRYNKLSALAQEKIKNFEQETKALLRRDGQRRPRTSVCTPQVEWEQIEKEWQKAKLELEQEDLLDYLADDPSYMSCLLNRGTESTELSPPTEFTSTDLFQSKSGIPLSSSFSAVKEYTNPPNSRSSNFPAPFSESHYQNIKFTMKDEKSFNQHGSESSRTKSDKTDIPTSVSQPLLSSSALCDRTPGLSFEEYSPTCKSKYISNTSHSESSESKTKSKTQVEDENCIEATSQCTSDPTHPTNS
ncbi:hypothetical protein CEXT_253061 [Caerostris extrusa]|uniref:Rho-GAP domain-containing protein n=1 Tax=Caerostris extrusa TaxID=172846 RepID=A0AAV4TI67_CAEEX|nr:hypothetical protein CEXT_253061 [Caerostris extrusa]